MNDQLPSDSDDARYRLLMGAITDYAIYMLSPEGRVSSWNPGAQRFKGYTEAEAVGRNFAEFYTPEDRANGLPQRALATAAAEGHFEAEGWRVRKDGSRFWAHVVIDPIWGSDGALLGYAKITRDLTERREAELELRQSEEQFRRLVEGVTDYAIYMLDPNGLVTNWNAGAERIKGYTREEIVGKSFATFYEAADRERGEPQRALEIARRDGRFEKQAWRVRKDGSRFLAHVVIDPILGDDGNLLGFAKITRDVTERVRAEHDLEVAREALLQAQKMEAIGQLTGGVAHDFNNLLMAVLGSLELLKKRLPNDPRMHQLLDNAVRGAERGAALTRRMLAFARRQNLEPQPVAVDALVGGMTDLLQRSLGPQIALQSRIPLQLPRIEADPGQLETAILNLALNARDAMPDGGPLLIEATEEKVDDEASALQPGAYVRLAVIDSGEGMDEQTLARAAEPFFTTKGIGKGTGLGLSMVHGLTEQMGGRLVLKSEKGKGTTAEVWLPVAHGTHKHAEAAPVSPAEPSAPRQLVIIAVDDDPLVLMNTSAMLEDMGHRVIEAYSAREALERLRSEGHVDLVVTDHAMPQMTGSQLASEIRSGWPGLPVVLATGYAELPPGGDNALPRLSKPFSGHDLERIVRQVTGNSAAPAIT